VKIKGLIPFPCINCITLPICRQYCGSRLETLTLTVKCHMFREFLNERKHKDVDLPKIMRFFQDGTMPLFDL
jgi:hypothetical protein